MNEDFLTFLDVPRFHRLADWFGVWAMESRALHGHLTLLRNVDLAAHVRAFKAFDDEGDKPPVIKSAIEKIPARNGQSVAVIRIAGTMMKASSSFGGASTVQIRKDVRAAASDSDVSGILLAIDSPGGTVAGTEDLANDVRAARRQKPVYAHIDDLGASAAYWVASQADRIYANVPTALVGSIGTMAVVYDASKAADTQGIEALLFATGPLKGAGTEGTRVTPEQRAHFAELTNQLQKSFDAGVKRGRGLTDKQLADVRTGGVYTAENAVSLKLIDGIQQFGKTLDELIRAGMPKAALPNGGLPTVKNENAA